VSVFELQLLVDKLVGTVVIDEEFCLFEVGSGGKWGIAIFWFPDVMSDPTFPWTVELGSRDDACWVS